MTNDEIKAWAAQLAADSVAAGEAETYGSCPHCKRGYCSQADVDRAASPAQTSTVTPTLTALPRSGVMGPVVTPEQVTALMRFAAACMEPWPECLSDYDGEMQGRLLAAGLIQPTVTPPYDQWEFDEQYADCEPGDECYFRSEFAKQCIAARSAPAVPTGVATGGSSGDAARGVRDVVASNTEVSIGGRSTTRDRE